MSDVSDAGHSRKASCALN